MQAVQAIDNSEMVLLAPGEVCKLIPGMTTAKLAQLRFKGAGPRFMKPTAKTVVYDRDDVILWLRSTSRTGTAEVA